MTDNKKTPWVFMHRDLDGVISYLALCWCFGTTLPYVAVQNATKLKQEYETWANTNSGWDKCSKLVILDLDCTSVKDLIDQPEVTIIDHHEQTLDLEHATVIVKPDYTSCCKLIYDTFKTKLQTISKEQKMLIALGDDYDSGKWNYPQSYNLNVVYHNTYDKVKSFIFQFKDGFAPYDKFQTALINQHKKDCDDYIKQLKLYGCKVTIQDKPNVKVCGVFVEKFVEETLRFILEHTKCDVVVGIMLGYKRVCFRSTEESGIDCSVLAKKLCDGGGHKQAAGGNLTENFQEFSKLFVEL
jgi:nanoRNase/pAp phosphatase (c-di-AMP/oligoRNAs hydrolase)